MLSHLLTWAMGIMLLVAQLFVAGQCSIGCRDNLGKPVDWFIVIKLPRLSDSSVSTVQQGVGQLYMDVNNEQWTLLDKGINDTGNHAVYNTLQQIYSKQNSQEMMFVLYNDEPPGSHTSLNHGHTKGQQFLYNYPKIYDSALPTSFVSANPNIVNVIKGKRVEGEPWSNVISLPSGAGQTFISFAKYTSYGADLYDALVAPYFKAGLNVETWLNGVGPLPSNCSARYKVMNVNQLKFLDNSYEVHEDHSKWAVSLDNKWICIGDINREEHQKERAGGTLCSQLRSVSNVFSDGIVSTEKCTSEGSKLYFRSWRFNQ